MSSLAALKEQAAKRNAEAAGLTLTRRKSNVENYFEILRAIGSGASKPAQIIQATNIPWLTAMQCLRSLEQNGFVQTTLDPRTQARCSTLTNQGYALLSEILKLKDMAKFASVG